MEKWDPFLKFLTALVVFFTGLFPILKGRSEWKSKKERETDRRITLEKEAPSAFTKDQRERKVNFELFGLDYNNQELREIMKLIIKSGYAFTLNHIRKVRDIGFFQSGKYNFDLSSFSPKLNDYGSFFGLLVCELGFICLIVGAVEDTFSPQISFLNQALIFCAVTTFLGCLLMFLCSRYYVALRIYRSLNGKN